MAFLGYLVQGEEGFVSNWSLVHFLSGLVPHAIWAYFVPGEMWVSLYLLVTAACLFELVENTPGAGRVMWTWIGYTTENYHIDTLRNSVSDVLFLLLGWLVSQTTHMLAPSTTAYWVLMGVAAALFLTFLYLFTVERHQWLVAKQEDSQTRDGASRVAATSMSTSACTTTRAAALRATPPIPSICGGGERRAPVAAGAVKPHVSFVL